MKFYNEFESLWLNYILQCNNFNNNNIESPIFINILIAIIMLNNQMYLILKVIVYLQMRTQLI
jgi:hypothetical protein